jgi:hypothetical protein
MPARPLRFLATFATALSTICLLATLTLWIRSYHCYDQVGRRDSTITSGSIAYHTIEASSFEGRLLFRVEDNSLEHPSMKWFDVHYDARQFDPRQFATANDGHYWQALPREAADWKLPTASLANTLGFADVRIGARRSLEEARVMQRPSLNGTYWGTPGKVRRNARLIIIPLWSVAALFAVLPALGLTRVTRRTLCHRNRRRRGHCPQCNYDLRATPARCAECGASADSPHT